MTIFSQSTIFQPISKNIKFSGTDLKVVSGANTLSSLCLGGVKIPFEQYQQLQIVLPKGQTNYSLTAPMLGIKTTFIAISATYCSVDTSLNYLKWKFQPSADAKWSMTNIMVLTGTTDNPIPAILIDNPNPDCPVTLNVLFGAQTNDYLNDSGAFVYLNGLTYDKIHTYNELPTGILTFYNSSNELVTSVNISDIVNVNRISGQNRLVIDESSDNNIILDFLTEYDTLQAFSAINWVLIDPSTRALPTSTDTVPPVITYTTAVVSNNITLYLSDYSNNISKADFIAAAIISVTDARDGALVMSASNIVFKNINDLEVFSLAATGTYTAVITVNDLAGNITTNTITIDCQAVSPIAPNPVFVFNTNVINDIINPINLVTYSNLFTANDAKVLAILNVTDAIDGFVPLSSVTVVIKNIYGVTVPNITIEGNYTLIFTATNTAMNSTTHTLTMFAADTSTDNPPEIHFSNNVVLPALTATLSLSAYLGTFTKSNAISRFITSVTDDVDGTIILSASNVTIIDNTMASLLSITTTGVYTVTFTVTDTNSQTTTKSITLTVNV